MNATESSGGPIMVVGYDGSATARAAVDYAADRAGPNGTVYIVHAYAPPPDWLGWPDYDKIEADHLLRGRAVVKELIRDDDPLHHTNYEIELLNQHPADAILSVGEVRGADEIVVGTRGLGRVSSAVLGSVSLEVVRRSRCPVVVIPRAAADAGGPTGE